MTVRETAENIAKAIDSMAEEIAKLVCDKPPSRNSHIAAGPLPPLAVPASLLNSLTARLDRLGPAKEIAQIGAVIGREFSRPLLAAAASESANWLQAALAQLVASGVIFASGELPDKTYTFKHALVRDAAYATLSRRKRQRLHSRIVDALENDFPFAIETQPKLLAHHLALAR